MRNKEIKQTVCLVLFSDNAAEIRISLKYLSHKLVANHRANDGRMFMVDSDENKREFNRERFTFVSVKYTLSK